MAAITIRNLDDEVQRRLKLRAAQHDRSMEAEARAILTESVRDVDFVSTWLDLAVEYRGDDVSLPSRSQPREINLT